MSQVHVAASYLEEGIPATPALGLSDHAAFARQVREIVKDLITPNPLIFWSDFLVSVAVGHAALWIYLSAANFSLVQVAAGVVAALAIYRVLMFTHELAHLKRGSFTAFRFAWNLLAGVPFLMPSFLYTDHRSHHVNHSYGTQGDGEYIPVGLGPIGFVYWFVGQALLVPIQAVVRFLVLGPVSLIHPRIRRFVWEKCSGLAQNNFSYRRPMPQGRDKWVWGLQEAGCFFVCAAMATLLFTGVLPWTHLVKLYALFAAMSVVSYTRALANHWYANPGGEISYLDQMFDSTTIPGRPFVTELWAPLGQRYHALHHLMPSIPYHSLGIAHRRLMKELPPDSPYHQTLRPSLLAALRELYHGAKTGGRRELPSQSASTTPN
jgi:fatty acid desaturase